MATLLHILLPALLLMSSAFGQDAQADERPDVLVILADDLGWHDVGFTGGTLGLTPNIDRLAAESTIFPNAYSDGPNCAPTRASLLTGLATPRHGIITVMSSRRGKAENRRLEPVPNVRTLDRSLPTLPGLLQTAGWRTAHLGKFHVGADPTAHGFTDSIGGNTRGHPKSYHAPYRNEALEDGPEGEYLTDRLTDEAIDLIRKLLTADHTKRIGARAPRTFACTVGQ